MSSITLFLCFCDARTVSICLHLYSLTDQAGTCSSSLKAFPDSRGSMTIIISCPSPLSKPSSVHGTTGFSLLPYSGEDLRTVFCHACPLSSLLTTQALPMGSMFWDPRRNSTLSFHFRYPTPPPAVRDSKLAPPSHISSIQRM